MMEPQRELPLQIKAYIENNLDLEINLDELANDGRIYAELGAGYIEKQYTRGSGVYVHPVLFITKGKNEEACIERLARISNHFKNKRKVPPGKSYTGRGLQVAAEPNKIGRQEDGMVLYSCIVNFKLSY